jgi:hypothetical protein
MYIVLRVLKDLSTSGNFDRMAKVFIPVIENKPIP